MVSEQELEEIKNRLAEIKKLGIANRFTDEEIKQVNHYVTNNVQGSILNQVLILTDKPLAKCEVYVAVYRIINSAKNYVDGELRNKLQDLLNENSDSYNKLYDRILTYNNASSAFRKPRIVRSIINLVQDEKVMEQMNEFIDIFFIFVEKQIKYELDKITGIDLETDSGKQMYKELKTDMAAEKKEVVVKEVDESEDIQLPEAK